MRDAFLMRYLPLELDDDVGCLLLWACTFVARIPIGSLQTRIDSVLLESNPPAPPLTPDTFNHWNVWLPLHSSMLRCLLLRGIS